MTPTRTTVVCPRCGNVDRVVAYKGADTITAPDPCSTCEAADTQRANRAVVETQLLRRARADLALSTTRGALDLSRSGLRSVLEPVAQQFADYAQLASAARFDLDARAQLGLGLVPVPGLAFSGATGVGKTHAAVMVLMRAVELGMPLGQVMLTTESALFKPGAYNTVDLDAQLSGVRVLLLDDFGRAAFRGGHGDGTDLRMGLLNRIVEQGIAVLVTTNLNDHALGGVLDSAVASRLVGVTGAPVQLEGEDLRRLGYVHGRWTPSVPQQLS